MFKIKQGMEIDYKGSWQDDNSLVIREYGHGASLPPRARPGSHLQRYYFLLRFCFFTEKGRWYGAKKG